MINLNLYRSVQEAYVHRDEQILCEFGDLVDFFREQQRELTDKTAGLLFNCCQYREDFSNPAWIAAHETRPRTEFVRRCRDNVQAITCLLLDVDGTMTLEEAVAQWADWEFLIYSTHSHQEQQARFRLVIPLARALTREEFDARHSAMCGEFQVDGASFTISQAFYLPSYSRTNRDQAFIHWNQAARRYDAHQLAQEEIRQARYQLAASDLVRTPIATSIVRTLMTGSDLHYADALTLAVVCKSNGITEGEYVSIVDHIAAAESDLRSARVGVAGLYQQAYQTHVRYQTVEQLLRKLNCRMWRWDMNHARTPVNTEPEF
jgi:hypothetical protein